MSLSAAQYSTNVSELLELAILPGTILVNSVGTGTMSRRVQCLLRCERHEGYQPLTSDDTSSGPVTRITRHGSLLCSATDWLVQDAGSWGS